MEDEARVLIKAGDVEIDLTGAQTSVDERLTRVRDDDTFLDFRTIDPIYDETVANALGVLS